MPFRNSIVFAGVFAWCVVLLGLPAPSGAQDAAPAPAYLSIVSGTATIDRDGAAEQALENMPVVTGDHLRTTAGRVEIRFPDGAVLDVDEFSAVELASELTVSLTEGRALMRVPTARFATTRYELVTPATRISVLGPGEYRLSYPDAYESARADEFDRWIDANRADAVAAATPYLPPNLQEYGSTLGQDGTWDYEASYGYVWYPRVDVAWVPYSAGYWAPVRPYGWTWIGQERWSWATHHYGRWGYSHSRWFWIPGRSWAPAWVAWGVAPGYVSWCPLGWDSRPLFSVAATSGHRFFGWTMVPRATFTSSARFHVGHHTVDPRRLPATSPVIVQARAPVAIPRHNVGAPAASAGLRAVAREGMAVPPHAVPRATAPSTVDAQQRFYTRVPSSRSAETAVPANEPQAPPDQRSPSTGGIYVQPRPGAQQPSPAAVTTMPRWGSPHAAPRVQPMLPVPDSAMSAPNSMLAVPRSTLPAPSSTMPWPRPAPPASRSPLTVPGSAIAAPRQPAVAPAPPAAVQPPTAPPPAASGQAPAQQTQPRAGGGAGVSRGGEARAPGTRKPG